jgi:tetratricopeptide (TPR) repeat protein
MAIYPQASHLLDTLDCYIDNYNSFRQDKCTAIRAKNKKLELTINNCQRLHLYASIIQDYVHVEADSALVCADRALLLSSKCNDISAIAKIKALRCLAQSHCGEVYLASVIYDDIDNKDIAVADRSMFYEVGFNLYSRAYRFMRNQNEAERFVPKMIACLDSINKYCNDAVRRRYYNDIAAIRGDNRVEGVADLIDLLTNSGQGTYLYGQMALEVARYYVRAEQNDLAKYYFTIAALNNLSGGYNETAALLGLGELLHNEGDVERANRYLKTTLDRALLVGDNAAAMRISQSLKTVLDDTTADATTRRHSCVLFAASICLLVIVVLCLLVFFYRKRNTYYLSNRRLSQKHNTKDYCIRQMLSLCANQISALEEYNRLVSRKIKGSQVKDLLRISEEGLALDDQLVSFHRDFDAAFLSMHPDFVDSVNKLMLADKHIAAPAGGALNTELRYLALMNLGLDDYQNISTLLGISQNSVYTYKNKIKSRASDRANFEENIKNIT